MKKLLIPVGIAVVALGAAGWILLPLQSARLPVADADAPTDSIVLAEPIAAPVTPGAAVKQAPESSVRKTTSASELDQAIGLVDRLSELVAGEMTDEDEAQLYQLLEELQKDAMRDPQVLKEIIEQFTLNPSSDLSQHLAPILAMVKGPEVEAMALDLARQEASPEEKMAGLELITRLGVANEKTLELTQSYLTQEDVDPELLRIAIYAMPVLPVASIESGMLVANLSSLALNHADDGVRYNSVVKIVEWAKEPQDLEAVVHIMHDKERSEGDRIGAALAVANSTIGGDAMRELFMARMADSDELWEIRRSSAEALGRFSLYDDDYAQLEAFKKEQKKKEAAMAQGEEME